MSESAAERIGNLAMEVMEIVEEEGGELGMIALAYEIDIGNDHVRYGAANGGGHRRVELVGLLEFAKRSVIEDAAMEEGEDG